MTSVTKVKTFISVFIDFADAFGSRNYQSLFEKLQHFDISDIYICLIEDVYKYPLFNVICGPDPSKIFTIPVQVFTDDIILSSYDSEVLHYMLRSSEPVMLPAGMEVKLSKCAVLHDGDQETTDTKVEK